MHSTPICPSCGHMLTDKDNFCPHCGHILHEVPVTITPAKQIFMYLISFFLAPFGLGWAFKYIRAKERKLQIIGFICLFLTILSLTITITFFKIVMDKYQRILDSATGPLLRQYKVK